MYRLATFSFVVLLGLTTLGAQTQAPNPVPTPESSQPSGQGAKRVFKLDSVGQQGSSGLPAVYVIPAAASLDCPVSMHAQHGSGGGMRFVRNGRSPALSGVAQHIHLSLGTVREPAMVTAARVTVQGTSAKWRTVPTALGVDSSADLKKTLDITFKPDLTASVDDNDGTSTDMVLPGFTSVQSITLDSLTYTDGSIWTPESGGTCRVAPDPLMLVDSRH